MPRVTPPATTRRSGWRLLAVACFAATTGCYSFSSYQSARLLQPGEVAVTPSVTRFQFTDEDTEWEDGDWAVEVQASAGVAERAEVEVKVARLFLDDGYQFVGLEPRFALVRDHVALGVLLGSFFGEDIDSKLQIHPSLVFGTQVDPDRFELVAAAKVLVVLDYNDRENRVLPAFNVGLRLSNDLDRWAVHPEFGVLIDTGDNALEPVVQFGLGVWVKP